MRHTLLVSEFLTTPWALMPERIAVFSGVIARWAGHAGAAPGAMDDEDFGERKPAWEARREQARSLGSSSIAVLPLYGTIVQRAGMVTEYCGGTSTQQFAAAFRDAMADEMVAGILIDIDSPGGSVYGVSELADEIIAARGKKPVVGFANSLAASAAYWVGCACGELYVTPGGEVGSIGVWAAHEDYSKYLEEAGVKTTLISAGKYKTEGNPYGPLDGDAQAFMQSRIDDYYAAFAKAVAKGRGVGIESVRSGMGQGRVLGADAALAEKMVDGVATFGEVVRNMSRAIQQSRKGMAGRSALAAAERDLEILG